MHNERPSGPGDGGGDREVPWVLRCGVELAIGRAGGRVGGVTVGLDAA